MPHYPILSIAYSQVFENMGILPYLYLFSFFDLSPISP